MPRIRLVAICLALVLRASAQQFAATGPQLGSIKGTVLHGDDAIVSGATAVLECLDPGDRQSVTTDSDGEFEFRNLKLGTPYRVQITAPGFTEWSSPPLILNADQYSTNLNDIRIKIADAITSVTVFASTEQIATEQLKIEEQQRIFGFIPNFYVVYDSEKAVPLTAKLKFRLAMKVASDPVTAAGIASLAAINQAANTPDYRQGARGLGQRVGTVAADGFSNILIGGAILPSLLRQDPRYFYQGTGTTKSRLVHALSSPFICRGDNGKRQPNYSTIGGDLASSAISNAYYPESNRGPGLVFGSFAINTAERMLSSFAQEFILPRFTSGSKKDY